MALNVYTDTKDIPLGMKIVRFNDSYFDLETELTDSYFEKEVLKKIDKARYVSANTFYGRTESFGALFKACLSTGVKTLLNIEKHSDVCFDSVECGQNSLLMIRLLRHGNILMRKQLLVFPGDNVDCDINYNNRNYSDFGKFIDDLYMEAD